MTVQTIPAAHGVATLLSAGQAIKIINTHGTQIVDTFVFTLSPDKSTILTQMSNHHTRAIIESTIPKPGDALYDNTRAKLLTITEDTTSGHHDTLIAACDRYRYEGLGCKEYHRNCEDNMREGLQAIGITPPQFTPSPLNLFMNIPIHEDLTTLSFDPPTTKAGQYVTLKAEVDVVIAFSACPQDIVRINGEKIMDAHFEII